jgi:hypothetical protein
MDAIYDYVTLKAIIIAVEVVSGGLDFAMVKLGSVQKLEGSQNRTDNDLR